MDRFNAVCIFITIVCLYLMSNILAIRINDNKHAINVLKVQVQDLQKQNNAMIQFLNKDEIKFMLESFDSLDTQLTNHLELILENQYAIAKIQQ